MSNLNRLGIEMLTLYGMPPVDHVRLAGELGCAAISTGLMRMPMAMFGKDELYPEWSLLEDKALRGEMKAAMADCGVHVGLGEGFRVAPEIEVANYGPQLDIFAELGARTINAIGMEPDAARSLDQYGVIAGMVRARGMDFVIEFAPPHAIDTAEAALRIADALGHDRCGLLVDAMHFFRSGGTVEQLATLPVRYAQMCDVPRAAPEGVSYMQEAMFERRVPGAGELPLAEWVAALPADCEIGLEVPNLARVQSLGARDHAAEAVNAARALGA